MSIEIIRNLPRADYDLIQAVNPSRLALMKKSPRHYIEYLIEETPAMKLGTAIHCAYLEPGKFKESYVVEPDKVLCQARDTANKLIKGGDKVWQPANKRMKDHKEFLAEWSLAAEKEGKTVIAFDDMEKLTGMLSTIAEEMRFPQPEGGVTLQEILSTRDAEVTAKGELYGFQCKGRIDLLSQTKLGKTIVDIKKTKSAHHSMFKNDIYNLDMDMKAAFYMKLFSADAFVWLAIDDKGVKGKHPIGIYNARHFLPIGEQKLEKYFATLAQCHKENFWPFYSRGVADIHPSDWMVKTHEDEEMFEESDT